jgi:hypothetical protein
VTRPVPDQPELVGVPEATRAQPGRCRVPTRFGLRPSCREPAEGTVAEWTAPLDPAQRLGSCRRCAEVFGLAFTAFEPAQRIE